MVQSPAGYRLLEASLGNGYWTQYCLMSCTDDLDDAMGNNHNKFADNTKLRVND